MGIGTFTDIVVAAVVVLALLLSAISLGLLRRDAAEQEKRWEREHERQEEH